MSNSTGELMEQQLLQLVDRFGSPQQIVSDHGTDLKKGIHLLRQAFPTIIGHLRHLAQTGQPVKGWSCLTTNGGQAFLTHCAKRGLNYSKSAGEPL